MNIQFKVINDDITPDLIVKQQEAKKVILEFRDETKDLVSQIASETIFSGIGKPSLQIRTGATAEAGMSVYQNKKNRRSLNTATNYYFSKITNLFENFQNRKQLRLLSRLGKEVEANSKISSIWEQKVNSIKGD